MGLVAALFAGFWLGVLSRSDLNTIDDEYYVGAQRKGSSIDYGSHTYNRRGLFTWEERAIKANFTHGVSIGLMGAGGGREVLALRRLGYHVEGWDCQPAFVALANQLLVSEGFEPSVVYAPRDKCPHDMHRHDGLVIGWGAYTLVKGRERRIGLLRELHARVDAGAPILVSFWTRNGNDVRFRITKGLGNVFCRLLNREPLDLGDFLNPNYVHYFDEADIATELAEGGFKLDSFNRTPYGHAIAFAVPSGASSWV